MLSFGAAAVAMLGALLAGLLIGIVRRSDGSAARLARLEAKVDALMRASNVTFDPFRNVPPAVRQALEAGDKILAIKTYREATGAGLKEAKDFVDQFERRPSGTM